MPVNTLLLNSIEVFDFDDSGYAVVLIDHKRSILDWIEITEEDRPGVKRDL